MRAMASKKADLPVPPCYFLWREGNSPSWPADEPSAADITEWCEPCQRGNAVWQRRKAARKERGKVLRQMHYLAKTAARLRGTMSMSTHVIGFRAADHLWRKHKAVWDACTEAEVKVPTETLEFFSYQSPDPLGLKVELTCSEWMREGASGIQIELSEVPKRVTHIRFYNAW